MNLTPLQTIITVIIFIVIVILLFGKRISEITFGPEGIKLKFLQESELQEASKIAKELANKEINSEIKESSLDWTKVATLFWLGNDLMWITDQLYRGSSPNRVLQGIENAREYLLELNLTNDSFPIQQLDLSKSILEPFSNIENPPVAMQNLLRHHYINVVQNITSIKWYISVLAEKQQPKFKKHRTIQF